MAADVGNNIRHLHPVDIIVPFDHIVEAVFPMHRHFWVTALIRKKESSISLRHPLAFRFFPVLDDRSKALRHVLRHGQFPCSCIRFCGFDHPPYVRSPPKLVVDIDDLILQVDIPQRQSTEFRNTPPCVEKDINHFVILVINIIVMHEFQELPHLVFCNGFPRHAVIDHHSGKFKSEGIFQQHIIINRHLECRAQDTAHGLDGAVPPSCCSFIRNNLASDVLTCKIFLSLKVSPLKTFCTNL